MQDFDLARYPNSADRRLEFDRGERRAVGDEDGILQILELQIAGHRNFLFDSSIWPRTASIRRISDGTSSTNTQAPAMNLTTAMTTTVMAVALAQSPFTAMLAGAPPSCRLLTGRSTRTSHSFLILGN